MVRLTDRPDKTLDFYRGRKTTIQQQPQWLEVKVTIDDHKFEHLILCQPHRTCVSIKVKVTVFTLDFISSLEFNIALVTY